MTRCSYCATWAGALRCDACGAPKPPALPLMGMPGRVVSCTSVPMARSDVAIDGRFYSEADAMSLLALQHFERQDSRVRSKERAIQSAMAAAGSLHRVLWS